MAVNSEKVELLGKGLYDSIPDVLTLQSIPTASELEFVSSEDFEKTMLDSILPQAVQENINFRQLLEIDFHWLCRALRILNYGPYFTTNAIYCADCGKTSLGEYVVDLRTVECKPIPAGFTNDIVIKKEEFLDFKDDIHMKLPTIQEVINSESDPAFKMGDSINTVLSKLCYSITAIGNRKDLAPIDIKMIIEKTMSPADYVILQNAQSEYADFGLRAAGTAACPKCGSKDAAFLALITDKFFRPTLGDLRKWRDDRNQRKDKDPA